MPSIKSKTAKIRSLNEVGRYAVGVHWTDGHESIYSLDHLRLEEELAVLIEDVYELDDQERKLLHATRPIRDPLDVLRSRLSERNLPDEAAEIDKEV